MNNTLTFHAPITNSKRYTVVGIRSDKVIKIGVAVCSPKDNFQRKLGRTIAEGRAQKNPTFLLSVNDGAALDKKAFYDLANSLAAEM